MYEFVDLSGHNKFRLTGQAPAQGPGTLKPAVVSD